MGRDKVKEDWSQLHNHTDDPRRDYIDGGNQMGELMEDPYLRAIDAFFSGFSECGLYFTVCTVF